jgi:hypothetical protein
MSEIITKTIITLSGVPETSQLEGDNDVETVKERFGQFFPWVLNCSATVRIEGGIKYITFAERIGTKG